MDLTGIGVLLMGIALLILAIFLARILSKVANVLEDVDKTVEQLPRQLDNLLGETSNLIHNSNDTLADVNVKLGTLTPLFYIIGDVGESTRTLSSSLVDISKSATKKLEGVDETVKSRKLCGFYGSSALGYYLLNKRKDIKKDNTPL